MRESRVGMQRVYARTATSQVLSLTHVLCGIHKGFGHRYADFGTLRRRACKPWAWFPKTFMHLVVGT
jgi:hypothetical protein